MIPLRTLRSHPEFAGLFTHVAVICWPILWWQLNALLAWSRRQGGVDLLYSVNCWGFITLRYAGTKPGVLYEPLERTFRPLTDASWSSALPACLETLTLAPQCTLILPRVSGGGVSALRALTEGALPSPLDSS